MSPNTVPATRKRGVILSLVALPVPGAAVFTTHGVDSSATVATASLDGTSTTGWD
ncbi:hypothetical protein [Streptomyces sp. NPDC018000]|uniref:hypothetical protein n=1 Tax=Streptomyces sp. NPDC018000 TaxID=3365028 RepID=UPI0037AD216E